MVSPRRAVAALAVAGLLSALAAPAHADTTFTFHNAHSGKCLEIRDYSTADFGAAVQYTCYGGANQAWRMQVVPGGGGTQFLVNVHSGKCLEVRDWSQNEFAAVSQYTCHGGANQQWRLEQPPGVPGQPTNEFELRNVNSGKCLEILDYSTADFGAAVQYTCYWGRNQVWTSPEFGFWPT